MFASNGSATPTIGRAKPCSMVMHSRPTVGATLESDRFNGVDCRSWSLRDNKKRRRLRLRLRPVKHCAVSEQLRTGQKKLWELAAHSDMFIRTPHSQRRVDTLVDYPGGAGIPVCCLPSFRGRQKCLPHVEKPVRIVLMYFPSTLNARPSTSPSCSQCALFLRQGRDLRDRNLGCRKSQNSPSFDLPYVASNLCFPRFSHCGPYKTKQFCAGDEDFLTTGKSQLPPQRRVTNCDSKSRRAKLAKPRDRRGFASQVATDRRQNRIRRMTFRAKRIRQTCQR